jgi:hypothetical protein
MPNGHLNQHSKLGYDPPGFMTNGTASSTFVKNLPFYNRHINHKATPAVPQQSSPDMSHFAEVFMTLCEHLSAHGLHGVSKPC